MIELYRMFLGVLPKGCGHINLLLKRVLHAMQIRVSCPFIPFQTYHNSRPDNRLLSVRLNALKIAETLNWLKVHPLSPLAV